MAAEASCEEEANTATILSLESGLSGHKETFKEESLHGGFVFFVTLMSKF